MKIFIPTACYSLKQTLVQALSQMISEEPIDIPDENGIILTLDAKYNLQETKATLEKAIMANQMDNEYLVVLDTSYQYDIAILKKVELELLGLYVCDLCGMILQNEFERDSHQTLDHKVGRYGGF